jgi:hypothetical protein
MPKAGHGAADWAWQSNRQSMATSHPHNDLPTNARSQPKDPPTNSNTASIQSNET